MVDFYHYTARLEGGYANLTVGVGKPNTINIKYVGNVTDRAKAEFENELKQHLGMEVAYRKGSTLH